MIMTANSKNQPILEMSLVEALALQANLTAMIAAVITNKGDTTSSVNMVYELEPGTFKPSSLHFSVVE